MKLEEILPVLKQMKAITRPKMDGRISLVKCQDGQLRLRMWRGSHINYPYTFNGDDIFAKDWTIYEDTGRNT